MCEDTSDARDKQKSDSEMSLDHDENDSDGDNNSTSDTPEFFCDIMKNNLLAFGECMSSESENEEECVSPCTILSSTTVLDKLLINDSVRDPTYNELFDGAFVCHLDKKIDEDEMQNFDCNITQEEIKQLSEDIDAITVDGDETFTGYIDLEEVREIYHELKMLFANDK